MTIEIFLLNFWGFKMHDKMTISAYTFEKSGKGPIFRPQMRAKDTFS